MTNPGKEVLELQLKEEREFREGFFSKSTPILPGSLFLAPNNEIITRPVNKPLFPEFEGVVEEIQPESIPFDIDLLLKDIKYFFDPPPNYNKERWELIPQLDDVKQEASKKDQTDSADVPSNDHAVKPPKELETGLGNANTVQDESPKLPPNDDAKTKTGFSASDAAADLAGSTDSVQKEVEGTTNTPEAPNNDNGLVPPTDGLSKDANSSLQHSTKDSTQTPTDDKQTKPSKPGLKEPPKGSEDQNPNAHKGGKHLHRTEHELNQTATETEDEESEQEEIHDTPAGSFHGTPERSTTGSKDEDYLEPENVEVVEPKGTRKSWRKQKVEEKTDSGNISENSDTPISQLKKV